MDYAKKTCNISFIHVRAASIAECATARRRTNV